MPEICSAPDISGLEIPMDAWTQPFWDATASHSLLLPACADCGQFRWPPGPFCPRCQSQRTEWLPAGPGRIYSFTVVREPAAEATGAARIYVPALIEFPDAGGVRLLAAIVDTRLDAIRIGSTPCLGWSQAANATVPVFRIPDSGFRIPEGYQSQRSGSEVSERFCPA
jgi:hypothetical protein